MTARIVWSASIGWLRVAIVADLEVDPVGVADIAGRLGVKQQTVAQWKLRGLLPRPRWTVSGTPVWQWADVAVWARETGRLKG